MKSGVIEGNLPEMTVSGSDCYLLKIFGSLNMIERKENESKINKRLLKKGGVNVENTKFTVRGLRAHKINGSLREFLFRTDLPPEAISVTGISNLLNLCKEQNTIEDESCRKCLVSMGSNSCIKHKIAKYL